MCEDVNIKISGSSYSRKIYLSAEDVLQVLYNKQVLNLSTGKINTLWTGDADLRLYITTVQDG